MIVCVEEGWERIDEQSWFWVKSLRFQRIGPESPFYFRDLGFYVLGVALPVHGASIYIACSEVLGERVEFAGALALPL